jgi:type I restriction enzyme S subunit
MKMTPDNSAWRSMSIGDLCVRITSGGTPLRSNRSYYDGGTIPWVKTGELKDWYIGDTEEKITAAAIEHSSAKLFPKDTILMAMYGDGRTITSLGILSCEAASNQACCALIVNDEVCKPFFLFYSLMQHRHSLLKLAYGGAQRNLNAKTIRSFEIPVPPLAEQALTESILSAYDYLIENNTRRIKILEQMAQMLYREWFVNFRFPGHEYVKMVESEMGLIPEGWEAKRMDEVAEVIDCLHTKKPEHEENGTGLLLQLFNIGENGKIDLSKKYLVNEEVYKLWTSRIEACAGDCVITNVGRIAAVGQIPVGTKAALGRNMTGIRPKRISPTFLIEYLLSPTMADEVAKKKDAGAIMDSLNVKGIVRLSVPVPPAKMMNEFELRTRPIRRQVEVLVQKNQNLRTTRDLLLPKLVTGEVSVETLEGEALVETV